MTKHVTRSFGRGKSILVIENVPMIVCPHCGQAGGVSTRAVKRKTGISGAKATAAIFTLGLSIFATGLRRKELKVEAGCAKCGSKWS